MNDDELREQRREDTHNALDDILECVQSLLELTKKLNALNEPDGCEQWQFSEITEFENTITDLTGRLFAVRSFLQTEYFREVDDMAASYPSPDPEPQAKQQDDSLERDKEMFAVARNAAVRLHEIIVALSVRLGPDRERRTWRSWNTQYLSNIANAVVEYSSAIATFFNSLNEEEKE